MWSTTQQPHTPSTFGYSTNKLVERDQRHMLQNRDRREAAMISGVVPVSTNPTASLPISAGYATETDRLQCNAARHLRQTQESRRTRHDASVTNLRDSRNQRQAQRMQDRVDEHAKALRDGAAIAGTGVRNNASVPYNVLNHEFTSESARQQAAYEDQLTRHSFLMRTDKLNKKLNPAGYNIINGTDRDPIVIPPKPAQLPSILDRSGRSSTGHH